MARQVIDLRRKETDLGMNLKAVADLLTVLGQAEEQRQQRAQTEQLLGLLGQGKDINQIGTELLAAPPTPFSPGISGIAQRIGSPFAARPNTAEILANLSLKQRFDEPTGLRREEIKSRIRASEALATQRETGRGARITTAGQKKIDSQNILTLNRPAASNEQIARALDDLNQSQQVTKIFTRNEIIKDKAGATTQADVIFSDAVDKLKSKRETIERRGFDDKRNGETVYRGAIQAILRQVVSEGFNPNSVIVAFNRWWDEQFEAEKDEKFQKFIDRDTFNIDTSDLPEEASVAATVTPPQQQVGDIIEAAGRRFRITGFDEDGEPLVDEI